MLCPMEKCPHYSKATKYPQKCYYEPQCWRGFFDMFIVLIRCALRRDKRDR